MSPESMSGGHALADGCGGGKVEHRGLQGHLSTTERRVLTAIADGLTRAEVATALGLSISTVGHSLTVAKEKLGAPSVARAVALFGVRHPDESTRTEAVRRHESHSVTRHAKGEHPRRASVSSAEFLRHLGEVSDVVDGTVNAHQLIAVVVGTASHVFGRAGCELYWWLKPRRILVPLGYCDPAGRRRELKSVEPDDGAVGAAFSQCRSIVVSDCCASGLVSETLATCTESVAAVPLVLDGRSVGVLAVRQHGPTCWSQDDVLMLRLLASMVGCRLVALERTAARLRRPFAEGYVAVAVHMSPAAISP